MKIVTFWVLASLLLDSFEPKEALAAKVKATMADKTRTIWRVFMADDFFRYGRIGNNADSYIPGLILAKEEYFFINSEE